MARPGRKTEIVADVELPTELSWLKTRDEE